MSTRPFLIALATIAILTSSCGKGESLSKTDLAKQIATEARPKLRVQLLIRTSADEPTAEDQTLLRSIEAAIERKNVGSIVASGSQPGSLFVTVEVENTADATTALRAIAKEAGVRERTTMRVIEAR